MCSLVLACSTALLMNCFALDMNITMTNMMVTMYNNEKKCWTVMITTKIIQMKMNWSADSPWAYSQLQWPDLGHTSPESQDSQPDNKICDHPYNMMTSMTKQMFNLWQRFVSRPRADIPLGNISSIIRDCQNIAFVYVVLLHKIGDVFIVLLQDVGVRLKRIVETNVKKRVSVCLCEEKVDESAGNKDALDLHNRFRAAHASVHIHLLPVEEKA